MNHGERRRLADLTVADLVDAVGDRPPPVVPRDAPLRRAVEALERRRHSRVVYVVDDRDVLVGVLTAGDLLRHLETHGHAPQVHARRIPGLVGTATAGDVMVHHPVTVTGEDAMDRAVRRMTEAGITEVPVVDDRGRVVADLTIIDVLYHTLSAEPRFGL